MKHTSLPLNDDELTVILGFLPEDCYANFSHTNKRFYSVVDETSYWKQQHERYLSHHLARKIENRRGLVQSIKRYPIPLSLAFVIWFVICFIVLFFVGAASFVSEHICQVSNCSTRFSDYCTVTIGKTCRKWETALVVEMSVTTRNATLNAVDQYFIKKVNQITTGGHGCIVSQISNSTNITTGQQIMWKDSLLLIEVNQTAEIPCFYNDATDFFFEMSFGVVDPKINVDIFWLVFGVTIISVGILTCGFTCLVLVCTDAFVLK